MDAKFRNLELETVYDIIDGNTGHWRTQGIHGAAAMATMWQDGDEAWPVGETHFSGKPIEIAGR